MLSLVTRSNQIAIDRISKEHTQNKVNQKELPQLKKYLSSLTKTDAKL